MHTEDSSTLDRKLAFIVFLICILVSMIQKSPEIIEASVSSIP